MSYLKKVKISNKEYFYLFHTVRKGNKFKKLSKYIGKDKPSAVKLEKLKKDFLAEIKNKSIKGSARSDEPNKKTVNIIAILQDLQERKKYLSREDMIALSKELDIPAIDIYGVATFYSQFRLTKPGRNKIAVCTGTACHVKGSNVLLAFLEDTLGIKSGQTTKDGKITLDAVNCIGACAKAPAMMVNDNVYGQLDRKKTKKIIENLK